MADTTPASIDLVALQAQFAQQVADATASSIKLLGVYTVDTLPTPNSAIVGRLAQVTDLFGEKTDNVLCSVYGGTYFWQPLRPFWARTASTAQLASIQAGTFVWSPLKMPSLLRIPSTFTLTASRSISLSALGAWPGAMLQLAFDGVLGLNTLSLSGLDAGSTLAVLLGGRPQAYYDGNAYQKF